MPLLIILEFFPLHHYSEFGETFVFLQVNVEGVNCDKCQSGKFGLNAQNPLGCSNCYCFGVTSQCSEAKGLIRTWVSKELLSHVML